MTREEFWVHTRLQIAEIQPIGAFEVPIQHTYRSNGYKLNSRSTDGNESRGYHIRQRLFVTGEELTRVVEYEGSQSDDYPQKESCDP